MCTVQEALARRLSEEFTEFYNPQTALEILSSGDKAQAEQVYLCFLCEKTQDCTIRCKGFCGAYVFRGGDVGELVARFWKRQTARMRTAREVAAAKDTEALVTAFAF